MVRRALGVDNFWAAIKTFAQNRKDQFGQSQFRLPERIVTKIVLLRFDFSRPENQKYIFLDDNNDNKNNK